MKQRKILNLSNLIIRNINYNLIFILISTCLLITFTGCEVPRRKPLKPSIQATQPAIEERKESKTVEELKIPSTRTILIGIKGNYLKVTINSESKFIIKDINSSENIKIVSSGIHTVKTLKNKILIDNIKYTSPIRLVPEDPKTYLRVENRRYRGNIILRLNYRKKLTVINELGIEDYICGIMAKEVSPDWPIESLKAQAVVARTFAIKNLSKHSKDGFDLCSETHCQVYGSVESEDERSDKAVIDTAGEIITYDGKMISSFYHSNCGGRTEDIRKVWHDSDSKNPEFFTGVKCGYCEEDKWYNWTAALSFKTIYNKLRNSGYNVGEIKKIKIVGHTSSDRVEELLIEHTKGKLWLFSHKFRMAMNPNIIRSTNFKTKISKNTVYFTGHGWGHGVGMCQWGAKGMAAKGWNYKEILEHYYKGTKIEKD